MSVKEQGEYPSSWYAATSTLPPPRPRLDGAVSTDICIIGGGLAGLTCALELARAGRDVMLLEANRFGWGASGRNGGFVSAGFAQGLTEILRRVGLAEAQALFKLSVEGAEYVRARVAEFDGGIHMGDGWLVALRYADPDGQKRFVEMLARDFHHELKLLTVAETRKLLKTERYFNSRLDPAAFHIHPLRYCLALAQAAERAGARLFEHSRVMKVDGLGGAGYNIVTADSSIAARHVVFCHNHPDPRLSPTLAYAMLPVATYIGVTEPLGERAGSAIATRAAIADTRRAGNYYRLVTEDRLLWGGKITTRVSEPLRLAEMMKQDMLSVYPQLGNPRMEFAWNGLMGYARHKMPIIGEIEPGHWVASSFGGHGLNTTAMAGLLTSRAILTGDDEWRRFTSLGAPWIGGWLGRAGIQISYWNMQLQDWRDERRAARLSSSA
jgi:glycine/D-amino acid oxidase-like deaminating enzyme